ncbi:hypothetical protein G6F31_015878 [Rhizopus arrhizus]|nr:hypothetical protein G6F31_015878 [Rhizopus arrhizus]
MAVRTLVLASSTSWSVFSASISASPAWRSMAARFIHLGLANPSSDATFAPTMRRHPSSFLPALRAFAARAGGVAAVAALAAAVLTLAPARPAEASEIYRYKDPYGVWRAMKVPTGYAKPAWTGRRRRATGRGWHRLRPLPAPCAGAMPSRPPPTTG